MQADNLRRPATEFRVYSGPFHVEFVVHDVTLRRSFIQGLGASTLEWFPIDPCGFIHVTRGAQHVS